MSGFQYGGGGPEGGGENQQQQQAGEAPPASGGFQFNQAAWGQPVAATGGGAAEQPAELPQPAPAATAAAAAPARAASPARPRSKQTQKAPRAGCPIVKPRPGGADDQDFDGVHGVIEWELDKPDPTTADIMRLIRTPLYTETAAWRDKDLLDLAQDGYLGE
eukprot:SAG22_NODE_74_length_22289_cov_65.265119_22_plen_162_part_00